MATMTEISAGINLIDVKKQNLHKSFLHLQSQSPSSFNLPLNWSDLDSYFTTLQSSLHSKFNHLQTLHSPPDPTTLLARSELKSFCENSDGLGLNRFIALAPNQPSILDELPDAYRFAPDAPAMVLDAMIVFNSTDKKGTELGLFRNGCLIMLEGLLRLKPDIAIELKDKAMELAVQWKMVSALDEQKSLGFVLLVGAYGLIDRFSIDAIIDCFLSIATNDKTIDLCRRIIPEKYIKDMIQNLIYKDMHVTAVKFIIQLDKTDEFSLVGLLEERKLRSMRVLEKKHRNAKYLDVWKGVTMIEMSVLKSIIKCIDDNHLEFENLKDSVVELVNKLQNELETCNHVKGFITKHPAKSKKPTLNNVQPTVDSSADTPVQNVKPIEESRSQKSVLLPDCVDERVNSPLGSGPTGSNTPSVNEDENSKQTSVDNLGLRKQPVRCTVLKRQLSLKSKILQKSKKSKLNKVKPTAERAAATSIQDAKWIQESHSQKSNFSPDECHGSAVGSGPTGSNGPSESPIRSLNGSTRTDFDYSFCVQGLLPPSNHNSNGWISD